MRAQHPIAERLSGECTDRPERQKRLSCGARSGDVLADRDLVVRTLELQRVQSVGCLRVVDDFDMNGGMSDVDAVGDRDGQLKVLA